MTAQAKRDIRRKLRVLEFAESIGNVRNACRYLKLPLADALIERLDLQTDPSTPLFNA